MMRSDKLSLEVNMLADLLGEHRTGAIEATALLQRVVEEVDVPLFAFDPNQVLRLVNSAGERILQQASPRLLGKTATELGLTTCLSAENASVIPMRFNSEARWFLRRSSFRQRGVPLHFFSLLSSPMCKPRAQGGGARRLAAIDPRDGPRIQKSARAD